MRGAEHRGHAEEEDPVGGEGTGGDDKQNVAVSHGQAEDDAAKNGGRRVMVVGMAMVVMMMVMVVMMMVMVMMRVMVMVMVVVVVVEIGVGGWW